MQELINSEGGSSPLDYIGFFDVVLMFLGIMIRIIMSLKKRAEQFGDKFELSSYWDVKHVLNWSLHIIVSTAAILILPEIFINYVTPKYLGEFQLSAAAVSALIGFFGYDLIKFIGKGWKFLKKKWGISESI